MEQKCPAVLSQLRATMSGAQVLTLQAIWLCLHGGHIVVHIIAHTQLYHFCHTRQGTGFIFSRGKYPN